MVQEAIVVIKVTYLLQPLFLSIELIEVFKETFTLPTASWSLNSSSSLYSPKAAIYHTEAAGGGGRKEEGRGGYLMYLAKYTPLLKFFQKNIFSMLAS